MASPKHDTNPPTLSSLSNMSSDTTALLCVGSVFCLSSGEYSDFCYITKITDKQIQYKPCVEMRVSPYTYLDGTIDYAYQAKLLPSPDSVKPSKMNITKLHPCYFTDMTNTAYGMIESTVWTKTAYPKYSE